MLSDKSSLKYSDWYEKQSRAESNSVSEEEINEIYESRKGDIDKHNTTNAIKNVFEKDVDKGIAEYLIDKGVRSEIINNPIFIKNIEYFASKSDYNSDINSILERGMKVDKDGNVSIEWSNFTPSGYNDIEGVSEKYFFHFEAYKDGLVSVDEISAMANIEKNPRRNSLDVITKYSTEQTLYNENGDIYEIRKDSDNIKTNPIYKEYAGRHLNGGVELLYNTTISSHIVNAASEGKTDRTLLRR